MKKGNFKNISIAYILISLDSLIIYFYSIYNNRSFFVDKIDIFAKIYESITSNCYLGIYYLLPSIIFLLFALNFFKRDKNSNLAAKNYSVLIFLSVLYYMSFGPADISSMIIVIGIILLVLIAYSLGYLFKSINNWKYIVSLIIFVILFTVIFSVLY